MDALIPSHSSPNSFTIQIRCQTPYAVHAVQEQLAGTQPLSTVQELAPFAGSGAAQWVLEQPVRLFGMTYDVVSIAVLVIDDVPMLFHPVSALYGNRIPQYAFLWGGFLFQGIENGDLLLDNRLGGMTLIDADTVDGPHRGSAIAGYLAESMDLLQAADFDEMGSLELGGAAYADSWYLLRTLLAYRESMEQDADLAAGLKQRLPTLDYWVAVWASGVDAPQAVVAVTVSLQEPTGETVHSSFHQTVMLGGDGGKDGKSHPQPMETPESGQDALSADEQVGRYIEKMANAPMGPFDPAFFGDGDVDPEGLAKNRRGMETQMSNRDLQHAIEFLRQHRELIPDIEFPAKKDFALAGKTMSEIRQTAPQNIRMLVEMYVQRNAPAYAAAFLLEEEVAKPVEE